MNAQNNGIEIPGFKDKYSDYVRSLENGNLNIDFSDFRSSFLNSRQYQNKGDNYKQLKRNLFEAVSQKKYDEVIRIAKAMLGIDYTSMYAHKYLQQAYKLTGDSVNYKKYHGIEFGLLNSIVKKGDGKSCETAWPVTQIEEEYFILDMIRAKVQKQSVVQKERKNCDFMEVKNSKGEALAYYFEITKVLAMEKKALGL